MPTIGPLAKPAELMPVDPGSAPSAETAGVGGAGEIIVCLVFAVLRFP